MELTIRSILVIAGTAVTATCLIAFVILIPQIKRYLPAFLQYRSLLFNLVSKDIKIKYRRSVLGLLWSVLQPLFIMLIVSAVFSHILRVGVENYPAFYITGILIFSFIIESTSLSLNSISGSASLLKKVYIPKYLFPLEKCLFACVNMLFSLIAVVFVYLILGTPLHLTGLLLPIPMFYAAVFSVGLGLVLSAAVMFFRDVSHLYAIWTTAWMYLTPVLYPLDILPGFMQAILSFNPLVYYVGYARDVMLYGVVPDFGTNMICIGFALVSLIVGIAVFKKTQDDFILHM
ncbi:MAG: ABC transporter permease [Coriobacteriales bacterium]|jgi:ABC-2 type transport system permease protein|nr:ABC transporter permease [Coriobacteriales bacterium]